MPTARRIQLRRTKGWQKPDSAVVVARPTRWGNPVNWRDYPDDLGPAEKRTRAVHEFEIRLTLHPDAYPSREEIRRELGGRDLACWCPLDQPCHADILLQIANGRC